MRKSTLQILGGGALCGGGMFTAMFWILAADVGGVLGAESASAALALQAYGYGQGSRSQRVGIEQ